MSKLIEKIVHNRIYNHLDTYNLLDKRQGGFRPTIAVYIDAMKAFDTVNHSILLQKLAKISVKGKPLSWI